MLEEDILGLQAMMSTVRPDGSGDDLIRNAP